MRSEVSLTLMLRILAILVLMLSGSSAIPDVLKNIPPSNSRVNIPTLTLADI